MGPWYVPICCSNGNVTCCANVHCIPLCYYIEKSYCTDIHGLICMYKDVFIYISYLLNKLLEMKEMYSSFYQMKTLYTHSLLEAM